MAISTAAQALDRARAESTKRSRNWFQLCLMFTRTTFGVAAVHGSAIIAWRAAKRRHTGTPLSQIPAGVPVWWEGGKHGHVALSAGGGKCWSNDILRRGEIDLIDIDLITRRWGYKFLGWSEDINGVVVYERTVAVEKPKRTSPTRILRAQQHLRRAEALLTAAVQIDGDYARGKREKVRAAISEKATVRR